MSGSNRIQAAFDPGSVAAWNAACALRPLAVHALRDPGRRWDADGVHRHPVPTWAACLRGVVRLETGPRRHLDLVAGTVAVLAPGVWHRHAPLRPGCSAWYQGLLPSWSDLSLDHDGVHLALAVPLEPAAALLESLLRHPSPAGAQALVTALASSRAQERRPPPAVAHLLHRIWNGFDGPLTAAEACTGCGLSPGRAHRAFTAFVGETPKRYIDRCRLGLARGLVASGAGVGAAAVASGYARRGDLTRRHRAWFGEPPSRIALPVPHR